jgi:CheY-like chemotaxis protein
MNRIKILFVEDDLPENDADDILWTLLINESYDVTPVRTGAEAWESLQSTKYDLVLLDIMLPPGHRKVIPPLAGVQRLDMGLYLLKELRSARFESHGTSRDVPVVVVSAVPGVVRWHNIGKLVGDNQCCLEKPVSPYDVVNAVKQALGKGNSFGEAEND